MTAGWAPWFSNSGFRQFDPGENADGTSMHATTFDGAGVQLQFHGASFIVHCGVSSECLIERLYAYAGTAVYVWGTANCTFDVTLDSGSAGSNLSSASQVLYSRTGLALGTHFLSLTAHPHNGTQFWLDYMQVTDVLPDGYVSAAYHSMLVFMFICSVDTVIPLVYDNQNATLQYSGDWTVTTDSDTPSSDAPKPYHQTTAALASVSLNFTNAVAIAIDSPRNWGHWVYNVVSISIMWRRDSS